MKSYTRFRERMAADPVFAEKQRARAREKSRAKYQRIKSDPEQYARYLAVRAAWQRSDNGREYRKYYESTPTGRAWRARQAERARKLRGHGIEFAGSVLAASSINSPGRDLLMRLNDIVPRYHNEDDRLELMAEAALLILEGVDETTALKRARKALTPYQMRNAKPIDDCYWL